MDKTLDDMLVLITKENIHAEIYMGFPSGKERLSPFSKNNDKLVEIIKEH